MRRIRIGSSTSRRTLDDPDDLDSLAQMGVFGAGQIPRRAHHKGGRLDSALAQRSRPAEPLPLLGLSS